MSCALALAWCLAGAGLVGTGPTPGDERFDTVTIRWEAASPSRPWLREIRLVPSEGVTVTSEDLAPAANMPHGRRLRFPREKPPVLGGAGKGTAISGSASCRVELADDYGFTFSAEMLRREPLVWLKDLGMLVYRDEGLDRGSETFPTKAMDALTARVDAARATPFRSTSEKYLAWTGYDEARGRQDDRAFEFAYRVSRPPAPRTADAIRAMPEVDYRYFCERLPDVKHRRMFLGWPNVAQEFYVLSNGALGASASSALGTGHPPAQDFVVQLGAGDPPAFKEHGDTSIAQDLDDGYHLVVHTRWQHGGESLHATAVAYPLAGEEVRTGYEPLAAFVRLRRGGNLPLWLRITPEHYGAGKPNPLGNLAQARIDRGRLMAGERIVLALDGADASIASAGDKQVLVTVLPRGPHTDLVIPYIAVDEKLVEAGRRLGFEKAVAAAKAYWDARLARGTQLSLPDPVVVRQFKTLYPRTLVTGDLDTHGDYALKTSPLVYDYVWLHCTSYGIEGLARRGHFEEARQYLEAGFRWQGSQRSDASSEYKTWDGFFTAPPRYTALLWLNYHGWFQWAAARYFLYSDDRAWLDAKLPALVKSLEWTASQRKLTMRENPDGSRPANYGWLPPGRVTDGSSGTSTFTDCVNWAGFNEVVRVLERIGHPRAGEFRQVADDYRRAVLRGMRLAARQREPVRLNDGTFVPYVPGYLESKGHEETMWYAAVVDGGLMGVLDSGIVPPGDPLEDWVQANCEDNLFVMAPNLADEGHFAGQIASYLRRDQPERAIYTFYSLLATQSSRQTLTTFEHRSWGAGRIYDLAPWPMGYYTRSLAGMLCHDEGDELVYCRATPRAWLAPGNEIRVERLQTRFGPTSFTLKAEGDRIRGAIDLATRYPPSAVRLRLRAPGKVVGVKLDGKETPLDPVTSTATLPRGAARVEIEARIVPDTRPGPDAKQRAGPQNHATSFGT
jgi:hypothetical protein